MRLLAFLVIALGSMPASAARFGFRVPAAWTVLVGPSATEEGRARAPKLLLDAIANSSFDFFAAHLTDGQGVPDSVSVSLVPLQDRFSAGFIDGVFRDVARGLEHQSTEFRVLEQGTIVLGGVTAGRMVVRFVQPAGRLRQIEYLLPGQDQAAIMSCTTTEERFSSIGPLCDAIAGQATGLVAAPPLLSRGAVVGLWVGGAGAAMTLGIWGIVVLARRRRKDGHLRRRRSRRER